MAKVVIAGRADCPYYARAELLGDKLSRNLPDFKLHKIIKQPSEWEDWIKQMCMERGWQHKASPIVWRELIDRGGKGVLIGGANEFQEYAYGYYGMESDLTSEDMMKIAKENLKFKEEIDEEDRQYKARSHPLHVCITNAASGICCSMIDAIGKGDVFGENMEIVLHLYDTEDKMKYLEGVQLEAVDLSHNLLRDTIVTSDVRQAFSGCGVIILIDSIEIHEANTKAALLRKNVEVYSNYAQIINEIALKNVRVLLAGDGPVNTNAMVMIENAPGVPRQNFAALSRIHENTVKAVIAEKLSVNSAGVIDLVLWGNVNGEHYIDLKNCRIRGFDGAVWGQDKYSVPALDVLYDKKWLNNEFPDLVKGRQQKIKELLKHPAFVSQAAAVNSMLNHWWNGSPHGEKFSLAVCSEGWYDVPEGIVFSFPVTMHPKGYWNVVQDTDLTDEMKEKIKLAVQDITTEKKIAFSPPGSEEELQFEASKFVDEKDGTDASGKASEVVSSETDIDGQKLETIAEDKGEEQDYSPPLS